MGQMTTIPESIGTIIARHKAVEGTLVGENAYNETGKISNVDPEEAMFNKGDEFEVPPMDLIKEAMFVSKLGTAKVAAVGVKMKDGSAKVLYLSTLRKRVTEYEETEDGKFVPCRDAAGAPKVHYSDKPVYGLVVGCSTAQDIVNKIAGKTMKVTDVLGPYTTSRIGRVIDDHGKEVNAIIGLRQTSIPVFEMK